MFTIFYRLEDGTFPYKNNPKNLGSSNKVDPDLWDYLGRMKLVL